jgi:sugar-phosphatase
MIFTCSAILFDLDGVLVNSIASVERQWRKFAARHGLDPELVVRTAHGHRAEESVRILMPHIDSVAEAKIIERDEIADTEGLAATEGAAELLAKLPRERWAVVTSGTRALATRRLQAAGLPQPVRMIAADEVRNGKPDPEPYLKGAEALGFAPHECLVFEDASTGILSAKRAGTRVVGLPGTYAAADLHEADALVRSLSDVEVSVQDNGELRVEFAEVDSAKATRA